MAYGFFNIKYFVDERLHIHTTLGQKLKKRIHISLFRPANILCWIIVTTILVVGIIAARSIGARNNKFGFLEIPRASIQFQPNHPDICTTIVRV